MSNIFTTNANNIEIRIKKKEGSVLVRGTLPTNSLSESMYNKSRKVIFKEMISSGAFDESISQNTPNILLNHNKDKQQELISFKGKETYAGFYFEAEINPTEELIDNLAEINGLSFGFVCGEDRWMNINGENIRKIISFKNFSEISILFGKKNFPAYTLTKVIIGENEQEVSKKEIQHLKQNINKLRLKEMKNTIDKLKNGTR